METRAKADPLYLVERNVLAASSLRRLLGPREIHILSDTDLSTVSVLGEKPIILVDATTLGVAVDKFVPLLRRRIPKARILVIAEDLTDELVCKLLACGAHGFLRYSQLDRLSLAIRAIVRDHFWVKPRILEKYVRRTALMNGSGGSACLFTSRESEVLQLVQCKLTNKEIGASINIAERTVKFHLANICRKLGVRGRCAVIDALQCTGPQIVQQPEVVGSNKERKVVQAG